MGLSTGHSDRIFTEVGKQPPLHTSCSYIEPLPSLTLLSRHSAAPGEVRSCHCFLGSCNAVRNNSLRRTCNLFQRFSDCHSLFACVFVYMVSTDAAPKNECCVPYAFRCRVNRGVAHSFFAATSATSSFCNRTNTGNSLRIARKHFSYTQDMYHGIARSPLCTHIFLRIPDTVGIPHERVAETPVPSFGLSVCHAAKILR